MRSSIQLKPDYLAKLYFEDKLSLREIATKIGTYSIKVRRALLAAGYDLRTQGEAQKHRLDSGKAPHPTAGKPLKESAKIKLSNKAHERWENMSDEERNKRSEAARDALNAREDKADMIAKGQKAILKTASEGSALEKHLAEALILAGFTPLIHQKHDIQSTKMHLDILLRKEGIAIEVDGPSHYSNVWSEEDLVKVKKRDQMKNGLLLMKGFHVIRITQPKSLSGYFKREAAKRLIEKIEDIACFCREPEVHYL